MSSDTHDFRSDLEAWMDMWDEAIEQGVHPTPAAPKPNYSDTMSGDKPQDMYYDYLDSELIQEEKTPNPVYPDSVGPDSEDPKPVWVDENLLKEIEALKQKLFNVENKMAEMGGGKKWVEKPVEGNGKLMGEVESLRKRIEKVSSQLGIESEPSPWQVKKE